MRLVSLPRQKRPTSTSSRRRRSPTLISLAERAGSARALALMHGENGKRGGAGGALLLRFAAVQPCHRHEGST